MQGIPAARVIERLDRCMEKKDYEAAEKHLNYWYDEAQVLGDKRGMLTVANEQVGFYRKTGKGDEAIAAAERALRLAGELGYTDNVSMGTTLVNAATAYKAFGKAEKAVPLYEKAREIYEQRLPLDDSRLGGLYNNMALALKDLKQWRRAQELFFMAIKVMGNIRGGEAEMAISYCNLADLAAEELGFEAGESRINEYIEKAYELLNSGNIERDGYYAFVCEKCAPAIGYHGFFLYEKELMSRAEEIYERS